MMMKNMDEIRNAIEIQLQILDDVLYEAGTDAGIPKTLGKLLKIRDVLNKYFRDYFPSEFFSTGDFPFDLGMLTGIVKRYSEDSHLEKRDIETLNNMYKKYNREVIK